MFKKGQPEEFELLRLGLDIVSTWESFHQFMCPKTPSLSDINESIPSEKDKMYIMLQNWRRSSGAGATYRALARVLSTTFINVHDLVKKHCHDEGK